MHLWDRFITQTVLTLNLLHQANTNPDILAKAYLHQTFDYNAMPLAPLGCAEQMHEKPHH